MRKKTEEYSEIEAYDAALLDLLILFPDAGHALFQLIFSEFVLEITRIRTQRKSDWPWIKRTR